MSEKTEVLFDPFPKQVEFLDSIFSGKFDFILYGGSIRGGKTFAGLGALMLLCYFYPRSRWATTRTDLQTLKKNTIPSFFKIVPESFIKSYNQDKQIVTFSNGSEILFFPESYDSDKELNRWKGLEVNGFLLEEINELQEKTFYKAIERAGSHIIPNAPKQPSPLIIATCNPTQGWVKKLVYTPWKLGELRERWKYIPSRIFDNPYIPEKYLESLKSMPSYEYEVFVNGDWDIELKTGGEFYKCFNLDDHVGDFEYNPELPLHISFDENVNPYITATAWQIHGEDKKDLRQIKEFCVPSPNNTIRKLCSIIEREYFGHEAGLFIYGDATSKKADTKLEKGHNFFTLIYDYLFKFRPVLRVPASNPSVVMRGNFINQVFEKGFEGISIKIDRNCINSISDYNNVKEDTDGTKKKTKATNPETKIQYELYGHTSDANDYFICMAMVNEYSIYKNGRPTFEHTIFGGQNFREENSY
ncbi:Terminase-like family [uncultured Caudovirales phage]|uniref:Terminase-like family n=1 Tax=uncultured Caudovirales phage TaxID=2100421 RepID=A0A6J5L572_9CAUD|nr:Terminase-like family [uncultured Caudovirales phage]